MLTGTTSYQTLLVAWVASRTQKLRQDLVSTHSSLGYRLSQLCAVAYFACVDQSLSDRIAAAIGCATVKPLQVKPASEAVPFRARLSV